MASTSSSSRQMEVQEDVEEEGRQEEIVITTSDVDVNVEGGGGGEITVSVDTTSGEIVRHQDQDHEDHGNELSMDLGDIFNVSQEHLDDDGGDGDGGQHHLEEGGEELQMNQINIKAEPGSGGGGAAGSGSDNKSAGEVSGVLASIPFSFPGQTFDTKCQKLILNVWDFFKKVKKNPDILDEIRTPQERAAAALHISAATIGKIGKNLKKTGKLETPGRKRKRCRPIVDSVKSSDEDVIKNIILEFKNNKIVPTLPMVLAEARQRIQFTGGATSFRRVLQRMGFRNLSQKNNIIRKAVGDEGTYANAATANNSTVKVKKEDVSQSTSATIATSSHHHHHIVNPTNNATTFIQLSKPLVTYAAGTTPASPTKVIQQGATTILQGTTLGGSPGVLTNTSISSSNNNNNAISFISANSLQGNVVSSNNSIIGGNQIFQITTTNTNPQQSSGNITLNPNQPIQLTQENAAALANAIQLNGGPQTFHIVGNDNTIRPIQIVYASNIQ